MLRRSFLLGLLGSSLTADELTARDWWGHRQDSLPSQFIFGYGSLINTASRNATAVSPVPAIAARISPELGYLRAWVDRASSGFTSLGLRVPRTGETATTVNGVVYAVTSEDLARFDRRESGYRRVEVPLSLVEAVSWQEIPRNGRLWVYVPRSEDGSPTAVIKTATKDFPLLQSYVDVVVEGALEYGEDFARELLETTTDWSPFWLNDRTMARRPWVYDRQYADTDRLLASTPPVASFYANRLLPEQYAAQHLLATSR